MKMQGEDCLKRNWLFELPTLAAMGIVGVALSMVFQTFADADENFADARALAQAVVTAPIDPVSAGGELTAVSLRESIIKIHRHLESGEQVLLTDTAAWKPSWSHVKTYRSNGKDYVLFVKGQTGKARIRRLSSDGTLGPLVGNYNFRNDIANVEIIQRDSLNPRLLLHQRITGRIIVRRINDQGEIGAQLTSGVHSSFLYKDLVRPFQIGSKLYVFSLSRWYGKAHIHALQANGGLNDNAEPIQSITWNKGWSSAQIYQVSGKTFLIKYKLMNNAAGNGGGKIQVKQFNSDGTLEEEVLQIPGDGYWSQGWSHFRLFKDKRNTAGLNSLQINGTNSSEDANDHGFSLLIYKIHNGKYKVLELSDSGIGSTIVEGNLGPGWTDLDPYWKSGKLYVIKLNSEQQIPFDYKMVRSFLLSLQGDYEQNQLRGGGYQVGIAQNGKLVFLHAAGFANRSTRKKLKTSDRSGIASVSKTFTTFTLLKLLENGEVGINDRLLDHLNVPEGASEVDYPFLPAGKRVKDLAKDVRIAELFTHTGRFVSNKSTRALWSKKGRKEDKCLARSLTDTSWKPSPNMRCARGYQNANTGLLGYMIMDIKNIEWADIDGYTQMLRRTWMNDANMTGVFCGAYDDVMHYRECTGNGQCINGYEEFVRAPPDSCLSGGISASSEDLIQHLSVHRYRKILNEPTQYLIHQTSQNDKNGNRAPYHWGQTLLANEGWMRSKAGGGKGVSAYIAHMPRGLDIVIISNTKPWNGNRESNADNSPSSPKAVQVAFTAATGIEITDVQDD